MATTNGRPHKTTVMPAEYDPLRRLVAAVVLTAVNDMLYRPVEIDKCPWYETRDPKEFLSSPEGQAMIEYLDLDPARTRQLLAA